MGRLEPRPGSRSGCCSTSRPARAPEAEFFLFEDRAYSHEAVKRRVDNVVRGLVSLGIRQGEHVGVLMSTRPSGLSVVAALNRLGAVAVLMRPDGPVAREAELGSVTRIVADPELAGRAREAGGAEVLVLGGGGEERDLGAGVIDMERIDPDRGRAAGLVRAEPGPGQPTSPSSCSPARASAPGPTGSPTGAGRCRRSPPPRRRRSRRRTPSTP